MRSIFKPLSFLVMLAAALAAQAASAQSATRSDTTSIACPAPVPAKQCVDFDASRSVDPGAGPLTYSWRMGDGTTLTGPIISYCYKELKNYLVELDVTVNKTGEVRKAEKTFQVILLDQEVVDFQASATTVHVGETVTFEATRALLPQCGKVALLWDFRDGRLANGPKATHSFRKPGTFAVRFSLRGEGPNSCTDSHCVSRNITVVP